MLGSEKILSMARKNYTDEFRRQAVDLYGTGSTTVPISSPRTPAGRPETQAEKVARLEAEVTQLWAEKAKVETEKSILRQAAKDFAGEANW